MKNNGNNEYFSTKPTGPYRSTSLSTQGCDNCDKEGDITNIYHYISAYDDNNYSSTKNYPIYYFYPYSNISYYPSFTQNYN